MNCRTPRQSILNIHWKEWCWSWSSNTLATRCKELTHLKRPWCWERLKAGGEGDDRGWDGWMGSPTQWIWVWVNSKSRWWTGRPGMLQSMGLQRIRHNWATELNWLKILHQAFPYVSLVKWVSPVAIPSYKATKRQEYGKGKQDRQDATPQMVEALPPQINDFLG